MKSKRILIGGSILLLIALILMSATYSQERRASGDNTVRQFKEQALNGSNDDLTLTLKDMTRDYNVDIQFGQVGDSSTTTIYVDGSTFDPSKNIWQRLDTITFTVDDGVRGSTVWTRDNVEYVYLRFDVNATDTVTFYAAAKMADPR